MKLAISSTGNTLDSQVDNRFARCQYFIIYDTETKEFEAITNEAALASGGAGIQAGEFIKNKGVEIVLTGNVGPNAASVLKGSSIGFAVGVSGTVNEAIQKYLTGEYKLSDSASVKPHFGFQNE